MSNPNPASPRMAFQWKYVDDFIVHSPIMGPDDPPKILNIGCADDPLNFGPIALHVDIDDWSYKHRYFKQADIHKLPFGDEVYPLVILGDVLEHVRDPIAAVKECCRVCSGRIVLTVFEEWRLPGHGQFIEEGHRVGDEESRKYGYPDREAMQVAMFPERKGYDDNAETHLVHVNQFDNTDMENLCQWMVTWGFNPLETLKVYEATHEGHQWYNWLMAFERVKGVRHANHSM